MTTKFVKRFKSVMACVAILTLGAIIIVVWVQFTQGTFSNKQQYISLNQTSTPSQQDMRVFNGTKHKEFIGKTHLEDIETDDVEFVKPLKISPAQSQDGPLLRHHNGHFRHKQAEEWDLHPHYQIVAFGQTLFLDLDYNDKFVAPNLHVVTQFRDDIQNVKHDPRISGCFYTGKVKGDKESSIAVSLCNGMTGYIRTSDSSYYIEPAETFHNGTTGSLIHRMKRVPLPTKDPNEVNSMEFYENSENLTIIEDDFYQETVHVPKEHLLQKRDIKSNTLNQDRIEGTCDAVEEKDWKRSEGYTRNTRNAEWSSMFRMSNESFVKVLVVADESMVKYHLNDDELTHYILTLMSHVSYLFKDETIGNAISVSVVQIMVLRNVDFSNTNSSGMLLKFCNWTKQNIRDKSHNVAVLLTRDTICRNESVPQHCTTLGVAEVDSVCQSGCAIVRDKGLASSYTIAHEMGHILSMPHDEDKKCQQLNKDISITNIMSKVIKKDTKPFTWSPCSRYFITELLDSNRATCLQKPPINNYISYTYTEILPGDKFDLDAQCELEFGPGRKVCLTGKPCEHLYCSTDNSEFPCISTFSPWADGTKCGEGRVCFNGECRFEQEYIPVDGGWGPWQEYGPCSRTCGGGVRESQRYCTSPKPANGGSYCIGENVRYESCNTMECDAKSVEFRAMQCSDFDGNTKDFPNLNSAVQWYPEYNLERPEDYCRLYCLPNNVKPSYRLKDKVLDGTKCGPSRFGICVNGICKPGGCDNILDSTVVLDDCGICGGDNSRCQEISGTYNKPADVSGYNKVVRIPKGSSNLNITQNSYPYVVDENYLVLIDGETGDSILNGNYMANTDGLEVKFGNIELNYSGASSPIEWITSPKNRKLPKDLVVSVLSVGKLSPPDIRYRYVIDIKEAPRYGWRLYQKQWSKCNSICEGKQYRKPSCVELITGEEVPKSYCDNMEDSLTQKQECNTHCELTWNIASKSACSPQCGKGIRRIYYDCMKVYKKKPNRSEIVNEKHCTILAKPPALETCNTLCNSTRWHYSPWSECSKTCGGGIQRRTAKCIDDRYTPMDDSYCNDSEMITQQICNTENCPTWTVADTSPCSVPCGGGYRNISYYCVLDGRIFDHEACNFDTKPPERETCNEQACGKWAPLNSYHSCSVTCGEGVERRKFICTKYDSKDVLDNEYCKDQPMPNESRVCYRPDCEERKLRIHDNYNKIIDPEAYNMRNKGYQWIPDDWSACSQSCGTGGRSKQLFRCVNEMGNQNDLKCNTNLRPNNVVQCNNLPCPKWKTGEWSSSCDTNCEKYRQVGCIDHSGIILNDNRCDQSHKPENNTKCKLAECPDISNTISGRYFDSKETGDKRYRWKVGPWKKCSNSCGKGTRRRHIGCEDALNEIMVVDWYCKNSKRPKTTKPCEKYVCKYAWIESYWSDCSASCGTGIKERSVTCHRVHHGGVVDPIPLPDLYQNKIHHQNYCSVYNKPPITAKCILSYCDDQYVWQPGPWRECSQKCGRKGRQTRIISCVNVKTKQKVHRKFCRKNLKPRRKRKCNQWRCLYKSCREVKYYTKAKMNNDYVISIDGRPVQIYCYKMDTPEPQEYISLHSDKSNFAEIYDKRLIDTRSCPYNGQRRDNCHCDKVGPRSGFTKFWKVRLNITSMQIIGNDFTFSKQLKGTQIPFGTAGDCYSSVQGCAQGRFSIDLTHTSFKLSSRVRWEKLGSYASADIQKTETSTSGKCGGYCGNCMPDPNIGLAVEIT